MRERHERASIIGTALDDGLVQRADDLGNFAVRFGGMRQRVGIGLARERVEAPEQLLHPSARPIRLDRPRQICGELGWWRVHAGKLSCVAPRGTRSRDAHPPSHPHVPDAPHLICFAPDAARAQRLGDFLATALPTVTIEVRVEPGGAPRLSDETAPSAAPALVAALDHASATLARGERASELRHALNNPLAALLAEAQLLEMDAPTPEQRET